MKIFLYNLITLSPQTIAPEGLIACAIVWFCVWCLLLVDIGASFKSKWKKALWIMIVSIVPVVGGAFYAIYCLLTADWTSVIFWRKLSVQSNRNKKSAV